jgi:hypothetical protein
MSISTGGGPTQSVDAGRVAHIGNLADVDRMARTWLAGIDRSRRSVEEVDALSLLAACAFWRGEFEQVDDFLAEADAVGIGSSSGSRALRRSMGGVVASLRGERDLADGLFEDALGLIGGDLDDSDRVVVLAMRAAFAGESETDRRLDNANLARKLATGAGDPAFAALAAIGEGWALAGIGRLDEAAAVLKVAAAGLDGPLERSVANLRLAEVEFRRGDRRSARRLVDDAREVFDAQGARYFSTRAAMLTGAIDRDRSGRWLRLARETAGTDLAYGRLFLPDGELRIEPAVTPGVRRDGEPVRFLTRHAEAAIRLLAAVGDVGVSAEDLGTTFWAGADPVRVRARVRTMLWQARNSLGPDAWRVQRRGEVIVLDGSGLAIVGTVTRAAVASEFGPCPDSGDLSVEAARASV